jgi:hypothetical protein
LLFWVVYAGRVILNKVPLLPGRNAASKAYLAVVMVNDFSRKRKPEAGTSIFFRREERLKNLSDEFVGYTMTVVCDYKMCLVSTVSQFDPKRVLARQGIESVGNKVRNELKDFSTVYLGLQTLRKIPHNVNLLGFNSFW